MKRALIVLLFALTAFAARGAEPAVAEKGVERPNVIEIRGGLTWDINSSLGYFFYAEYARHMKGKFWLGGRLGEAYETLAGNPVSNMVLTSYFATTAYGIGYWEFPVARKWLSFRVGGGVGMGGPYNPELRPLPLAVGHRAFAVRVRACSLVEERSDGDKRQAGLAGPFGPVCEILVRWTG